MILLQFQMGVKFENLNIPVILVMPDREYENPAVKMVSSGIFFIFPFSAVNSFSVVLHLVTLNK